MRLALFILLLPFVAFGQAFVKYDTNTLFLTSSNIFDSNIVSTAAIAKTKGANGQLSLSISNGGITDSMLASTFKKLNAGETNLNAYTDAVTNRPLVVNGFAASTTNVIEVIHGGGARVARVDTNGLWLTGMDVVFTNTTTDATITTLGSVTLPNNSMARVDAYVCGYIASDFSNIGAYLRGGHFVCTNSTATLVGSVVTTGGAGEHNTAWDCTLDTSGQTFRVRVTGAASTTIKWSAVVRVVPHLW